MPAAAATVAGDTAWGECAALLRAGFASFAQHRFHELNSRTLSASSWHHGIIAAKLEAVREAG